MTTSRQSDYVLDLEGEALDDMRRLDATMRRRVVQVLDRILVNPTAGAKRLSGSLANCFEHHVANHYRIVYKIHERVVTIQVIAIGKRENLAVYRVATERVANQPENRAPEPN